MIDTLTAPRVPHFTSIDVAVAIAALDLPGNDGEIPDGAALAIAAGWQAPGGHGLTFAALIGHFPVDVGALLDAIADARRECDPRSGEARALDCLATWALNHPSRTYPLPRNA